MLEAEEVRGEVNDDNNTRIQAHKLINKALSQLCLAPLLILQVNQSGLLIRTLQRGYNRSGNNNLLSM